MSHAPETRRPGASALRKALATPGVRETLARDPRSPLADPLPGEVRLMAVYRDGPERA